MTPAQRTRRARRVIGILGAAWAVLMAAAFAVTLWRAVIVSFSPRESIGLSRGCFVRIHADTVQTTVSKARYPRLRLIPAQSPRFRPKFFAFDLYWIPLWIPFIPGAAAAMYLLPARRKRGACPACGYDLRANPSSVCPECGA